MRLLEKGEPELAVRAKELAGREYGRLTRLPPDDPARKLIDKTPPPRLQYLQSPPPLDAEETGSPGGGSAGAVAAR